MVPVYGIDFAGGTLIQIKFTSPVRIDDIKSGLGTIGLSKSSVQQFGQQTDNEFLIRTETSYGSDEGFTNDIKNALESFTEGEMEIRRVEMVGPQVGEDLRKKALFAMFYALLFITIYISGRFELKWMLSGVVAATLIGAVYIFNLFNVSIPFLIGGGPDRYPGRFLVSGIKICHGRYRCADTRCHYHRRHFFPV